MGSGKEAPAPLIERAALATKKAARPKAIRKIPAIRFIRHLHTQNLPIPEGLIVWRFCVTGLLQSLPSSLICPEPRALFVNLFESSNLRCGDLILAAHPKNTGQAFPVRSSKSVLI